MIKHFHVSPKMQSTGVPADEIILTDMITLDDDQGLRFVQISLFGTGLMLSSMLSSVPLSMPPFVCAEAAIETGSTLFGPQSDPPEMSGFTSSVQLFGGGGRPSELSKHRSAKVESTRNVSAKFFLMAWQ